ncbi:SDR family oxidoreductase [Chloroflexota bacterium]
MKNIVITGSTSGIGYGLADSFLSLGCSVAISGRSKKRVESAVGNLYHKYESTRVFGCPCDVTQFDQVNVLWETAKAHFGNIHIWINNAGIGHPETNFWDFTPDQVKEILEINLIGAIYGSMVAFKGMLEQGYGSIYNLEGLGSSGTVIKGMGLYATTKAAITYLTKAMAKDAQGTAIVVGGLRPGMTVTKMITGQYHDRPEEWERFKRIFNILGDRVETVTPWMAKKALENEKNGATINWLTKLKIMKRFLQAPFYKRTTLE